MSELKTIYAEDTFDEDYMEYHHSDKRYYREVYLKSEADKVIAEKDEKIDELKERIDELQKATDSAWGKVNTMYDELSHNKYKRCFAMAMLSASECVVNQDTYKKYLTHKSEFRIGHFRKWYFRWLDIAEKFNEAK